MSNTLKFEKCFLQLSVLFGAFSILGCNAPFVTSHNAEQKAAAREQRMANIQKTLSGNWTCTGTNCLKNEVLVFSASLQTLQINSTQTTNTGDVCTIAQTYTTQSNKLERKPLLILLQEIPGQFQLVSASPSPTVSSVPSPDPSVTPSPTPTETVADTDCLPAVNQENIALGTNPGVDSFTLSLDSTYKTLTVVSVPAGGSSITKVYTKQN